MGAPCSKGLPTETGALCPYISNCPRDDDETAAWDIAQHAPLRYAPTGTPLGFDWTQIAALLHDNPRKDHIIDMLRAAEQGFMLGRQKAGG